MGLPSNFVQMESGNNSSSSDNNLNLDVTFEAPRVSSILPGSSTIVNKDFTQRLSSISNSFLDGGSRDNQSTSGLSRRGQVELVNIIMNY